MHCITFYFQVAVLGLCELIMHPSAPKPFEHIADKLIPYFITLLKNLRVAYQLRREEENEESDDEEGEEGGLFVFVSLFPIFFLSFLFSLLLPLLFLSLVCITV